MTQGILMLGQLVILPMQLRQWGQAATAQWYAALALATITYVVDCGLRTAGHAELIKANHDAATHRAEFSHFLAIWSWIRIFIVAVTVTLAVGDALAAHLSHSAPYPLWRTLLIVACALETVLTIRLTFLDSLGYYRGAEASYFFLAVLRLAFSIPLLLLFHGSATGLAVIYLASSAIALGTQSFILCRKIPLLQLTAPFPRLSWSALGLARYTVAEPISIWVRLSLPVLIIRQIASPVAVTTYVALRAVFGGGRTTIQQLARVASVEVLKARADSRYARAESLLCLFIVVGVFFGSFIGLFVVLDNLRILGLWLRNFDLRVFQAVALAFALTAPFFSYQIPMNLMFRTGYLAWVAKRHYAFVIYSAIFAATVLVVKSLPIYLGLLVAAEVLLSMSFFASGKARTTLTGSRAGATGIQAAALCSLAIVSIWFLVRSRTLDGALQWALWPMLESAGLLIIFAALLFMLLFARFGNLVHSIRNENEPAPALVVSE